MNKVIERSEKRQALVARCKSIKEQGLSKRVLESWLDEDEINIDLDHILQIIQNNRNNPETLQTRTTLLVKLQEISVQTNRSYECLQAINELIEECKYFKQSPSPKLFIAKWTFLHQINFIAPEIDDSLTEATINVEGEEQILDIYLCLSSYYIDTSQYKKAESILLICEQLSTKINNEYYLSMTWVYMGMHYHSQYDFQKTKEYLNLAITKLNIISSEKVDIETLNLVLRRLNTCLHYLGLVTMAEGNFPRAAEYYIMAQSKLEECQIKTNIIEPKGATAFYHLRMGELLKACNLNDSAEFHYQKSRVMFNEIMVLTGIVQVELALAELSKELKPQEKQILESANQFLRVGYVRGEAMALFSLLKLYLKHRKFLTALKTFYKILRSQEVRNLTNQTHVAFFIINLMLRVAKSIIANKPSFLAKKNESTPQMLYRCPCSDPLCKTYKQELIQLHKK